MAARKAPAQSWAAALFLIVLLSGQEVHAARGRINQHTYLSMMSTLQSKFDKQGADDTFPLQNMFGHGHEALPAGRELDATWNNLTQRANADGDEHCEGRSQELLQAAYDEILHGAEATTSTCQAAVDGGKTHCLGATSEQTGTTAIRRVLKFPMLLNKFHDCGWAADFISNLKSKNGDLITSLTRTYQSAPELKELRGKLNLDFAAFRQQVEALDAVMLTKANDLNETVKDGAENLAKTSLFDAVRTLFQGIDLGVDWDEASAMFANDTGLTDVEEKVTDDITSTQLDSSGMVVWCFRQYLVEAGTENSDGCSRADQACYRFTASAQEGGEYSSQKAKDVKIPPDFHTVDSESLELVEGGPEEVVFVPGQGIISIPDAAGYKRNSLSTWGVCLSKTDPHQDLSIIKEGMGTVEGSRTETSQDLPLAEAEAAASSFMQKMQAGTMTQGDWATFLLQVPAIIGLWLLIITAIVVYLVIAIAGFVIVFGTFITFILGGLGDLIRYLLILPLCAVGGIFLLLFAGIYAMLVSMAKLGERFGGQNMYDLPTALHGFNENRETVHWIGSQFKWCDPAFHFMPCGKSGYPCAY